MAQSPMPKNSIEKCDTLRFLTAWLSAPLRTGALLPSGRFLAKAMAEAINPDNPGFVVELGAGTGALTEALIKRGIEPERLILVETREEFRELLSHRYPKAQVLSIDAYNAARHIRQLDIGSVSAIVSGLPLLTQTPWKRRRLLLECLHLGTSATSFIQFTYFYRSPIPVASRRIKSVGGKMIWPNLWPARVWTYRIADMMDSPSLPNLGAK